MQVPAQAPMPTPLTATHMATRVTGGTKQEGVSFQTLPLPPNNGILGSFPGLCIADAVDTCPHAWGKEESAPIHKLKLPTDQPITEREDRHSGTDVSYGALSETAQIVRPEQYGIQTIGGDHGNVSKLWSRES